MSGKNKNRGSNKRVPITLDDEGPISNQAEIGVKREEMEEAPLPTVAELQEKVAKLEDQKEKLIKMAGKHLHRAETLEIIIDKKPEILKESKKEKEELEKKVAELQAERVRDRERMDELEKELADAKNELAHKMEHIASLVKQTHTIKDERLDDQNQNLSLKNNVLKEKRSIEELQKQVIELMKENEESKKEKEELRRRLMEIEKRTSEMNGPVPIVNDELMEGNEEREEPMEMVDMGDLMGDSLEDNALSDDEVGKRRRSTRNVSRTVKYDDFMDESDEEDEPSAKKKRSESVEKNEKVVPQKRRSDLKSMKKDNDTEKKELECPECEFRSRTVYSWIHHLKVKHSTTPILAGCLLRCDCGNESHSYWHSHECNIANFTVIRKGNDPIRRLTDPPVTPQCVLCKAHPTTPYGYISHLKRCHKTTLLANGFFLLCSCGLRYNSEHDQSKHDKKCTGHDFTLHKIDED